MHSLRLLCVVAALCCGNDSRAQLFNRVSIGSETTNFWMTSGVLWGSLGASNDLWFLTPVSSSSGRTEIGFTSPDEFTGPQQQVQWNVDLQFIDWSMLGSSPNGAPCTSYLRACYENGPWPSHTLTPSALVPGWTTSTENSMTPGAMSGSLPGVPLPSLGLYEVCVTEYDFFGRPYANPCLAASTGWILIRARARLFRVPGR